MLQCRDRDLVEVTQSLSRPGQICVTPRVALTPCPARAQPGAVLALVVLMLLFPEPGSSQGRGLPEEGIIHFQECLSQWELLESSSGLGVFPQHWTALSTGAGEPPGISSMCPPGCLGSSRLIPGAAQSLPGWAGGADASVPARAVSMSAENSSRWKPELPLALTAGQAQDLCPTLSQSDHKQEKILFACSEPPPPALGSTWGAPLGPGELFPLSIPLGRATSIPCSFSGGIASSSAPIPFPPLSSSSVHLQPSRPASPPLQHRAGTRWGRDRSELSAETPGPAGRPWAWAKGCFIYGALSKLAPLRGSAAAPPGSLERGMEVPGMPRSCQGWGWCGDSSRDPPALPTRETSCPGRTPALLRGLFWVEFLGSLGFVGFSCCLFGSILPCCPTSAHSSSHPLPLPSPSCSLTALLRIAMMKICPQIR